MKRSLHLLSLFAMIVVLALLMLQLRVVEFDAGASIFHPKSLAATGFIILAAFAMGEFFKLLNIPALLGYIAAGLLFGPNFPGALNAWGVISTAPEALFSTKVIADLTLVNVLTVGVIGTMGGGELILEDIKANFKAIVLVVGIIFCLVVPSSAAAVLWIARDAPQFLPFLDGMSLDHHYAAALLFGVFGVAMSPAATLAILQETRATGRFTSLALGIVIVADLVLVAFFLFAFEFDKILLAPGGFGADALLAELPKIGAEFGYALVIGGVTGLIFILYLRFVAQAEMFFTIIVIFGTTLVSETLHAETLAAFLTAGFIVQNFSKQGHDMIHALEKISLPVFVIYFMTQAALLDLQAVLGFAVITVVLTLVRAVALYVGATLGADLANADGTTRRYLWLAFFSRGGVDLVLAAKVGSSDLPWGAEFQTVIMACVVVHIVIGPPLLKLALDWAGETEGSRRQSEEEAEAFDHATGMEGALGESFPTSHFADPILMGRVRGLRELLVRLHRDYIADPLEAKAAAMRASLQETTEELHASLDQLDAALTSTDFASKETRAAAVAKAHIKFLHDIADNVHTWEQINPEIVHRERIQELVEAVRNREDFASVYHVEQENFFFEPQPNDRNLLRAVKSIRRLRRAVLGVGTRSVPLGRLWRYYVELMITGYLARAADSTSPLNERFWADLGNHMRRVDDLFDAVYDAVLEPTSDSSDEIEPSDEHAPLESPALRLLHEMRAAATEREAKLVADLETLASKAVDRYTVPLRETFGNFLSAAERAGTYQLPGWRYRASALFDTARRAEAKFHNRLRREHTIVTGQRGWIVAEWQLVLFLYWLTEYEREVRETLRSLLASPVTGQLDVLRAGCESVPPEYEDSYDSGAELRDALQAPDADDATWQEVDWEEWLQNDVRPSVDRARTNFQRMLGLYSKGHVTRQLIEPLEKRVAEFSEEIVLLSEHPDKLDANRAVPTLTIPLREWFVSEVVREAALQLVEFNERGEAILRTCLSSLEDVQQVIEFSLLTAHRDVEGDDFFRSTDVATGGMERASRMLDEMCEAHERRFEQLTVWVVEEANKIAERAAEPFLEHSHSEIESIMHRRREPTLASRGENWAISTINRSVSVATGTYRRYLPIVEEVVEDLQGLFVEEVDPIQNAEIRERLRPDGKLASEIPAIYRRLFAPVPLDIPDFYVERREIESRCAAAIGGWVEGLRNTVLIHGDRGVGKRSTLQHILQHGHDLATLRDNYEIHHVQLDDDLQTEAEIVSRIGAALPNEPAVTMEGLVRFIEVLDTRHVVVIENGEKLFSRTETGLDMARRFLRAMSETSNHVLWIVLMGTPAVTYLDTAFSVTDFFTHVLEIGPLSEGELSDLIQKRHRVSGFRASFERDRPRIRDWVRRPIGTSDALRDPKAEYFRDLARLSGGNPMTALMYWLESARLDDADDHLIWLRTLPDREPELLSNLSLSKRLILASLVQHHTLTPMQLRAILRRDFEEVQTELDHLQRLGFIRPIVGRHVTAYQLRDLAEGLVTTSLRDMNMI